MEGNRFKIYQDPITKNDFEGNATVILEEDREEGSRVFCLVIFDEDDDGEYYRWVDKHDEIIG